MNIIPKTILYNSKHPQYATKYLSFTKEVGNLVPITFLNKTFSCLTCNNISKDNQSVHYTRAQPISSTNKSNLFNDSKLSKNALAQANNNTIVNPLNKVIKRQIWNRSSDAEESGYGPNWPSRLGRVRVKKQRKQGMDILEDNGEEQAETKEVIEKVNTQISQHSYGRLFAVVLMERHQHKITSGDLLMCNHDIGAPLGKVVKLDKSLLIGGKDFTLIGRPFLPRDAFQITATVVEKNLSQQKICYRKLKRVKWGNPSTKWIRDYTTTLRINSIELLKPVDKTIDRAGYEKPLNKNPLNGYE